MAIKTKETSISSPNLRSQSGRISWLRDAQQTIRNHGASPFEFTPISITGEPLSETIIRERRDYFDAPLSR
jgi:hypothetical protein